MNVVLVLNRQGAKDFRIMVRLHTSKLKKRVTRLLEEDKGKEAFDLMLKEAEVIDYLPSGKKPAVKPAMIMIEDLL